MILIADSGSTKTDWAVVDEGKVSLRHTTVGINPFHQSPAEIRRILLESLQPALPAGANVTAIYFYGSGCTPEKSPLVSESLRSVFPHASSIEVVSDLLGAARAVCGNHEGIACILGTGANSCLYDGCNIVRNTPPLGYILGDEGSGAVLGKLFMNAIFKGFVPGHVRDAYLSWAGTTYADVIDRVYRQPQANRFLASVAPFIREQLSSEPALRDLVVANFRAFFHRNLVHYGKQREVGFVGSIAWAFGDILRDVANEEGYQVTTITRSPMEGLVVFHVGK